MRVKRRTRPTRRCAAIATAVGLLSAAGLGIAVPAQGSSCTLQSHTVVMNMPGASDFVELHRVGTAIYNGPTACGAATVGNTDFVIINDTSPNGDGTNIVKIDLGGGALAPGLTNEGPGDVSEIEVLLILRRGTNTVWVTGSDEADDIHAGVTIAASGFVRGIDLNAGAEQGKVADADVTYQEAPLPNPAFEEPLVFEGGAGDDTLDASGGAGFYTGVIQPVTLTGSAGDDRLVGGGATDTLHADPGNDVIDGDLSPDSVTYASAPGPVTVDLGRDGAQDTGVLGTDRLLRVERLLGSRYDDVLTGSDADDVIQASDGDDVVAGRGGNDTLDGGWGSDTASYRAAPAGVRVNVGTLGPQNTGGAGADALIAMENLAGSPFADVLTGDAKANTLTGWEGDDSLSAEGGDDHVAVRDGARDLVTCGPGTDAVDADEQGVDSIFSDCETSAFAPFLPPQDGAGTPPPADPAGTGPSGTGTADTVAPVLDQLTLDPRRFPAARSGAGVARVVGTTVAYRLSEAATTRFRVERARAGRRVDGRCVRPTSANRRAHPCRRWRQLPGTLVQAGGAGVNRLAFDGRLGGTRLRPGRYRLRAVATDGAANRSPRRTAGFTIVR